MCFFTIDKVGMTLRKSNKWPHVLSFSFIPFVFIPLHADEGS